MFAMQIRNFFCLSQGCRVFADLHTHVLQMNACVCVGLSVVVSSSDRHCSIKQTNFRYFSNNVPRIRACLASSAHCKLPVGTCFPSSSWYCCCTGGRARQGSKQWEGGKLHTVYRTVCKSRSVLN